MIYDTRFAKGFQRVIDKAGVPVRIRYFTQTIGSVWDDEVTLAKSGNDLWTSGVVESLNLTRGSIDANLLEQGKIINTDSKVYLNGSIFLTGSQFQFKLQVGSPAGINYSLIPEGGIDHQVDGTAIFKCAYVRRITGTGSILGE